MFSLAYVSRPTSSQTSRAETLLDIQMVSIARNSSLDITGVLITTSTYIAQVLEGPASAVNTVMASILRDSRHHDIVVIKQCEASTRCFPLWRVMQFDQSHFADTALVPMLAAVHAEPSGEALFRFESFINALGRPHGDDGRDRYHCLA